MVKYVKHLDSSRFVNILWNNKNVVVIVLLNVACLSYFCRWLLRWWFRRFIISRKYILIIIKNTNINGKLEFVNVIFLGQNQKTLKTNI
jgi:hypothetical protein